MILFKWFLNDVLVTTLAKTGVKHKNTHNKSNTVLFNSCSMLFPPLITVWSALCEALHPQSTSSQLRDAIHVHSKQVQACSWARQCCVSAAKWLRSTKRPPLHGGHYKQASTKSSRTVPLNWHKVTIQNLILGRICSCVKRALNPGETRVKRCHWEVGT